MSLDAPGLARTGSKWKWALIFLTGFVCCLYSFEYLHPQKILKIQKSIALNLANYYEVIP